MVIHLLLKKGKIYNIYNIGSNFEYRNIDVVKLILSEFGLGFKGNVKYIKDRPFNDFRYSIDIRKIKKLSWLPIFKLEDKIHSVVEWYKKNYKQFL